MGKPSFSVDVFVLQNPRSKLVGFAALIIDDVIRIEGFKIFDGAKGMFVAPPSHKGKDKDGNDTWYDDVRFLEDTEEGQKGPFQMEVEAEIINEYGRKANTNSRQQAAQAQEEVSRSRTSPVGRMGRTTNW